MPSYWALIAAKYGVGITIFIVTHDFNFPLFCVLSDLRTDPHQLISPSASDNGFLELAGQPFSSQVKFRFAFSVVASISPFADIVFFLNILLECRSFRFFAVSRQIRLGRFFRCTNSSGGFCGLSFNILIKSYSQFFRRCLKAD